MINLFIPWICLLLVVLLLLACWKKWYKCICIVFTILLLVNLQWRVFSLGCNWLNEKKNSDSLRVMTWNVSCSDSTATDDVDGMLSTILEQDADVVFLTEYGETIRPEIDSRMSKCYPYKGNIANWITWCNLYSRELIDTCMRVGGEDTSYLFRYDLRRDSRIVHVYCAHLQSNNLVNGETFYPDSIADRVGIERYLDNYNAASEIRRMQAEMIVSDMTDMSPNIVMGDMNDICGSPCMKVLTKAGLHDAWMDGGFGYGATIHEPLAYRIDHIMYSVGVRLKGIKKVDANGLSDHDALVADFEIE